MCSYDSQGMYACVYKMFDIREYMLLELLCCCLNYHVVLIAYLMIIIHLLVFVPIM